MSHLFLGVLGIASEVTSRGELCKLVGAVEMRGMGLFIYPSEVALHLIFKPRKQSQTLLQLIYLLKVCFHFFFLLKQQLIQVSELGPEVQEGLLYHLRAGLLNTVAISHCRYLNLN